MSTKQDLFDFFTVIFILLIPILFMLSINLEGFGLVTSDFNNSFAKISVIGYLLYLTVFYKEIYRARVGARWKTTWGLKTIPNPDFDARYAHAS